MNTLIESVKTAVLSMKETSNTTEVAKQLVQVKDLLTYLNDKKSELESILKSDKNFTSVLFEGETGNTKVSKIESKTTEVDVNILDEFDTDQIKKIVSVSSTKLKNQIFFEGWMEEKFFTSKPKAPSIKVQAVKK
jgi:hypothetical protein